MSPGAKPTSAQPTPHLVFFLLQPPPTAPVRRPSWTRRCQPGPALQLLPAAAVAIRMKPSTPWTPPHLHSPPPPPLAIVGERTARGRRRHCRGQARPTCSRRLAVLSRSRVIDD